MRRILVRISYEGGGFCGSARQPGRRTVQGELEAALRRLGETPHTLFASRTDAGVHALDAPVALDISRDWPPGRLLAALNAHLPPDIRALTAEHVPPDFNPRHRAIRKRYTYALFAGIPPAPLARFVHVARQRPDVGLMVEAARRLVGTHDFSGLLVGDKRRRVWTLDGFRIERIALCGGEVVLFCLEARSFGYKMVRCICGLVVEVGCGRVLVSQVEDVAAGRRRWRRLVLPPEGLCLVRVDLEGVKCGWPLSPISTPIFPPSLLFLRT